MTAPLCAYCFGPSPLGKRLCCKACEWGHKTFKGAFVDINADLIARVKAERVAPGPWIERVIEQAIAGGTKP